MTDSHIEALTYDQDTAEAGWDSPERAQHLVGDYVVPGSVVLDIGIGTGQAVRGYPEKGATVVGIDHDIAMIEAVRIITGVDDLRAGDINEALAETFDDSDDSTRAIEHFADSNITVFRHSEQEITAILEKLKLTVLHKEAYVGYSRGNEDVSYEMFLVQRG